MPDVNLNPSLIARYVHINLQNLVTGINEEWTASRSKQPIITWPLAIFQLQDPRKPAKHNGANNKGGKNQGNKNKMNRLLLTRYAKVSPVFSVIPKTWLQLHHKLASLQQGVPAATTLQQDCSHHVTISGLRDWLTQIKRSCLHRSPKPNEDAPWCWVEKTAEIESRSNC